MIQKVNHRESLKRVHSRSTVNLLEPEIELEKQNCDGVILTGLR